MSEPSEKLALGLIIKDDAEVEMLRRCLNSVAKYVDGIFITATNKPNTRIKKLCKEYGAVYSFFKWVYDFSAARNFNFSQVPKEYNWILWLDADDVLRNGQNLKKIIKDCNAHDVESVFFNYLYQVDLDENGNIKAIVIEHLRERLIRNNGYGRWIAPIHETYIAQREVKQVDDKRCDVVHLTTHERRSDAINRNIEILEKNIEATKRQDPRPIYYLGKAIYDLR